MATVADEDRVGEAFGLIVKYHRTAQGLSLRELSSKLVLFGLRLSKDALAQIESGVRRVSLGESVALEFALEIDHDLYTRRIFELALPISEDEIDRLRLFASARHGAANLVAATEEIIDMHATTMRGGLDVALQRAAEGDEQRARVNFSTAMQAYGDLRKYEALQRSLTEPDG